MKLFSIRRKRLKPADLSRFNQSIPVLNWRVKRSNGEVIIWSCIGFVVYLLAMGYVGTYAP